MLYIFFLAQYKNICYYCFYVSFSAVKVNNALTQINFNGTNFINAARIFHGPTVVGEMEMHGVANLATLQTLLATFFPSKKCSNLI